MITYSKNSLEKFGLKLQFLNKKINRIEIFTPTIMMIYISIHVNNGAFQCSPLQKLLPTLIEKLDSAAVES